MISFMKLAYELGPVAVKPLHAPWSTLCRARTRGMVLDEQQWIRKVLGDRYLEMSSRNPSFSLRAFAKKLNVSSAALSEILRGKRKVSLKKALDFAARLKLSPDDIAQIERAFTKGPALETIAKLRNPMKEHILTPSEFPLFEDWLYFALIGLTRTIGFRADPRWMAARLGVSEKRVRVALEHLIQMGCLEKRRDGTLVDTATVFRNPEDFPLDAMNRRQFQTLDGAREAIGDPDRYGQGAFTTIAGDPARLDAAWSMVETFAKKLSLFLAQGERREIFELGLQLFARSR